MGGAQAGEAPPARRRRLREPTTWTTSIRRGAAAIIKEANRRIYERAADDARGIRHGNDDHRRACRGRRARHRPRRRLPGVSARGGSPSSSPTTTSRRRPAQRAHYPEEADTIPSGRDLRAPPARTAKSTSTRSRSRPRATPLTRFDGLTTMVDDDRDPGPVTRARPRAGGQGTSSRRRTRPVERDNITVVLPGGRGPSELEDTMVASGRPRPDDDLKDTLTGPRPRRRGPARCGRRGANGARR
jgi:hypothetical protein